MFQSVHTKVVVESYNNSQGVRTDVRNGIAFADQKKSLVGLKMLAGLRLIDGTLIPEGSTAYFYEDTLMAHPWAKDVRTCSDVSGNFIVGDLNHVVFFKQKDQ